MGGWGGHFILQGGNDCDGRERGRQGGRREMQTEGNKQRKTEKRKNVRRMKSNQASKDEKIRSNPKNRSQSQIKT